jgi:hypothetical protein
VTAKEGCAAAATARVKRSEFAMLRGTPPIGDDIALTLGFEGDED